LGKDQEFLSCETEPTVAVLLLIVDKLTCD
jgi:hypothetical protein